MRFPFTFMGLLSIGMGAWISVYAILHPTRDGLSLAFEVAPAAAFLLFGAYVLYRRVAHGKAA